MGSCRINLLCISALLLSFVNPSASFGGFFGTSEEKTIEQAGETIAFGITTNPDTGDKDVTMQVQINFQGPAEEFSWIVPVMYKPTDISVGSEFLFLELFESSKPTFTLNVAEELSTTCSGPALVQDICRVNNNGKTSDTSGTSRGTTNPSGPRTTTLSTVPSIQNGYVGPYDYFVLEPNGDEPGGSVIDWLKNKNYSVPETGASLIDYYSQQGHSFVLLELKKSAGAGEIQPIVIKYTIPQEEQLDNIVRIPIQLTSIAAAPDMPVQIYVFSEDGVDRAFPSNYLNVQLDNTMADWVGCLGSPNCYLIDMRSRLKAFLEEDGINQHAFITEYAGPVPDSIQISLDIDINALMDAPDYMEFLRLLADARVPAIYMVHHIIEQYIPNVYMDGAPMICTALSNVYQPSSVDRCFAYLEYPPYFDAVALAEQLNNTVFGPALEAQEWIESHAYMTRFYGLLSPENMDRDPFFAFNHRLSDVSNVHTAQAVPICENDRTAALDLTVDSTTYRVPAEKTCNRWRRTDPVPYFGNGINEKSVALEYTVFAYGGEGGDVLAAIESDYLDMNDVKKKHWGVIVERSSEDGFFVPEVVELVYSFMGTRVPNQTVVGRETYLVNSITNNHGGASAGRNESSNMGEDMNTYYENIMGSHPMPATITGVYSTDSGVTDDSGLLHADTHQIEPAFYRLYEKAGEEESAGFTFGRTFTLTLASVICTILASL